ncbi:response regulator transcription factor [Pseudobacteroides cellulosolvens]|uniref:Stage 0 sporulation protein A homolog n=1 Tax=Pseudobacteroides cellulosolvens ATCC 35603 = DSM 2933 TaxID=398512 RepID=A0A0L6JMD0_9FIRM|nr:response regulator transcription factor [Pseudobacteroides cellulosolvens]KNY26547.1 two component transcriptional regulator, LuxR family [Pseudobacteroides cellulosolvens ATCC 35603 = DSM 2933]
MDKIKVMLVEDDPDWIKVMANYLNNEEDICVTATATNKNEAVILASNLKVDIILMDINLDGNKYDGIYAAAEINMVNEAKIIMLTSLHEKDIIIDSFTAGAINYISKRDFTQIPNTIRSSLRQFNPMEVLLNEYGRLKEEEQLNSLSISEKEVFKLLAKGYTNSQIEKELYKSRSTLKNQINKIYKKIGVFYVVDFTELNEYNYWCNNEAYAS